MGKNGGFYKQQFLKSLASYDGDFTSTIFESSVYCMSNFVQYFNNFLPFHRGFLQSVVCVMGQRPEHVLKQPVTSRKPPQ